MIDVVRVLIPSGTLVSGYDVQCFWYPSSRHKKGGRKIRETRSLSNTEGGEPGKINK